MKILNLYAGIGGNRTHWDGHEVTSVEFDPLIAEVYQKIYPNDTVICGDAVSFLEQNFDKYDLIWASPPCPSHGQYRHNVGVIGKGFDPIMPDMTLYSQIIFLQHYAKAKWVIENVKPYYEPLVRPSFEMQRHLFWSNFFVPPKDFEKADIRHKNKISDFVGYEIVAASKIKKQTTSLAQLREPIGRQAHLRECYQFNQQTTRDMDFLTYCKLHDILIDHLPPLGVWRRYPTVDHPSKRNGAVKFMGDHGFVQNWATNIEVEVWKSDSVTPFDRAKLMRDVKAAELKRLDGQRDAARNAAGILKQCVFGKHDYLKAKGFDEEEGNIFIRDGVHMLVIPMRVGGSLVGCQLIDPEGGKKFLFGQRTSGATFSFDNKGPHYLCEGYATALSVRQALKGLKKRYTLHVCFSAYNMKRVAELLKPDSGYLIADNDASGTGERVAKEIGWPYWMSDTIGEDANDAHKRMGLFKFSQSLTRSLHRV